MCTPLSVLCALVAATGCGNDERSWPPEPPFGGCTAQRLTASQPFWVEVTRHQAMDCPQATEVARRVEPALLAQFRKGGVSDGDTFRVQGFRVVAHLGPAGLSWRARRGEVSLTWRVLTRTH
jgi:hypothetical protein